jgi:hypothetical protein
MVLKQVDHAYWVLYKKEHNTMSENFRRRMENTQEDVIVALNTGLQERKIRNLAVLETIVKTVLLCGQQNLALRGHRDDSQYTNDKNINTGNFSALLRYRADGGDELLQEHFKNAPSNATYISKTTQNEVISIIGDSIQRSIVNDCNALPKLSPLVSALTSRKLRKFSLMFFSLSTYLIVTANCSL